MEESLRKRDDRIINPQKALRFLEEDLEKVELVITDLDDENPIGIFRWPYKRHPTLMFKERHFPRVIETLNNHWISYIEVPTVAVSALPLVDQRIIRNGLGQWEELLFEIEALEDKDVNVLTDREKEISEIIREASEIAKTLPPEKTINPEFHPIYFDDEFKEKGSIVVLTQYFARGREDGVLLVSTRVQTILDKLNISFHHGYPKYL